MENSETATMALTTTTTTTTTPPPPKTEAEPVSEAVIALEKSAAKETKVAPKKSASPTAAAAVATIAAKPRPRSEHPSAAIMVKAAIRTLHERNGSSVHAIKKYIAATYKIDSQKFAPFIKKSLKSCVISGKLVQTKGKGASGSFKLPLMAAIVGTNNQKSSTRTMPTKVKKNVEIKKKGAVGAVVKKVIVPKRIGRAPKMTKKVLEKKKQVQEEKKQEEKKEKKTMMKVAKIKTLSKGATKKAPTAGPKAPKPKKVSLLLEGKRLGRTSALLKKK